MLHQITYLVDLTKCISSKLKSLIARKGAQLLSPWLTGTYFFFVCSLIFNWSLSTSAFIFSIHKGSLCTRIFMEMREFKRWNCLTVKVLILNEKYYSFDSWNYYAIRCIYSRRYFFAHTHISFIGISKRDANCGVKFLRGNLWDGLKNNL